MDPETQALVFPGGVDRDRSDGLLSPENPFQRPGEAASARRERGEPPLQAVARQSVRLMFLLPIINYVGFYFYMFSHHVLDKIIANFL